MQFDIFCCVSRRNLTFYFQSALNKEMFKKISMISCYFHVFTPGSSSFRVPRIPRKKLSESPGISSMSWKLTVFLFCPVKWRKSHISNAPNDVKYWFFNLLTKFLWSSTRLFGNFPWMRFIITTNDAVLWERCLNYTACIWYNNLISNETVLPSSNIRFQPNVLIYACNWGLILSNKHYSCLKN